MNIGVGFQTHCLAKWFAIVPMISIKKSGGDSLAKQMQLFGCYGGATVFRTYKNSTTIVIETPGEWPETSQLMHEIGDWAAKTLTGNVEIHPVSKDRVAFKRLHVLCELAEDATLVALKWQ